MSSAFWWLTVSHYAVSACARRLGLTEDGPCTEQTGRTVGLLCP